MSTNETEQADELKKALQRVIKHSNQFLWTIWYSHRGLQETSAKRECKSSNSRKSWGLSRNCREDGRRRHSFVAFAFCMTRSSRRSEIACSHAESFR